MKSKLSKKIKVIIIAGGVLLVSTAALVAGIVVAQQVEENKIVRTAYADDSAETEDTNISQADSTVKDEPAVEDNAQMQTEDMGSATEEGYKLTMQYMVQEEMQQIDKNTYVPQTLILADIDSSHIATEKAMSTMVEYIDTLCEETIDAASLSATFYRVGSVIEHDIWHIFNTEFSCAIDAKTGEILILEDYRGYKGEDSFANSQFRQISDGIQDAPEEHIKKAKDIVAKHFAQGRNIEHILFAGVTEKSNGDSDSHTHTYRVYIKVLLESGRSYEFCFMGSELYLTRFDSFPSQEGCYYGFLWEDEAYLYPEILHIEESSDNSPEIIIEGELGSEHISAEQAINTMTKHIKNLYGADIDIETLSANFNRSGYKVKHDIWGVRNSDYSCAIDAITGNIISSRDMRDYIGSDEESKGGFWQQAENIRADESIYTELAAKIVNAFLADGRKIEFSLLDAIQAVYNDNDQEQTVLVDVHVLMDTGRSYTLSFIGSERYLYRFWAHPSQEGAMFGFYWEEEASEYPSDWQIFQSSFE